MGILVNKAVNIKDDLTEGDVSIYDRVGSETNSKYHFKPVGILVTKATSAIVAVKVDLEGGQGPLAGHVFYLTTNVVYNFMVTKVHQTGTATGEEIFLLGQSL